MKLLFLIVLATTALNCPAADEKQSTTISPVLSTEFGKLIEIEGKIVDDTDTRIRAHLGKKLLEVHRVGTIELKQPVVIELLVFGWTDIKIPVRGSRVRFRGYETGGFTGIPNEAFEDIPLVATTDYHFESRFQITKQLQEPKAQQDGTYDGG